MDLISIIIPCLNEEEAIPIYYREMQTVMEQMNDADFELIFVDDGSSDGTLPQLIQLAGQDKRCRYLSFSRNFGKEAAMYAGLSNARGDYAAIMDADLQDPPRLLPVMYEQLVHGGYDCVAARRATREQEPFLRSVLSFAFYRCINRISDTEFVSGARDYRLMSRRMVDAVLKLSECSRFSKGIFSWVGFRTKWLEYPNEARAAGETKWSLGKLFLYAAEGISGFSTAPLILSSLAGLLFCCLSLLLAVGGGLCALFTGAPLSGMLLLFCGMLFIGGVQLLAVGIASWYLSRTYLETKHRPLYILKESSEGTAAPFRRSVRIHRTPERKTNYETA